MPAACPITPKRLKVVWSMQEMMLSSTSERLLRWTLGTEVPLWQCSTPSRSMHDITAHNITRQLGMHATLAHTSAHCLCSIAAPAGFHSCMVPSLCTSHLPPMLYPPPAITGPPSSYRTSSPRFLVIVAAKPTRKALRTRLTKRRSLYRSFCRGSLRPVRAARSS